MPSSRVQRLARNNFSDGGVFSRSTSTHARHIEVQIFGDGRGDVVALGERDCSAAAPQSEGHRGNAGAGLDRRHARAAAASAPCGWASRCDYRSAGTVEFVYDARHAASSTSSK